MRSTLIIISFCFVNLIAKSQSDAGFLKHLYKQNLDKELFYYLNTKEKNSDSLNFKLLKYSLYFRQDSLFYSLVRKQKPNLVTSDSLLVTEASLKLLHSGNKKLNYYWYDTLLKNTTIPTSVIEVKKVWLAGEDPAKNYTETKFKTESNSYSEYKKMYNKKPLVAASLSAIVPGLGKLYIKKPRAFLGNLLATAAAGAQTAEAISKLGINHPFTIFDLSVAGLFYLSNIYGSYNDCRIAKKMKKRSYLNEANKFYTDYFNFNTR